MSENLYYTTHDSAIGKLLVVASNKGVRFTGLVKAEEDVVGTLTGLFPSAMLTYLPGFFTATLSAIDDYLAGKGQLELPVDLAEGTPLQRSVWLEIARIPYGETISYTTLAERVGFPRAVRAVASACGSNPVPLIIPCHRVLAKDGSLGGFSLGGLETKEFLLQAESQEPQVESAA